MVTIITKIRGVLNSTAVDFRFWALGSHPVACIFFSFFCGSINWDCISFDVCNSLVTGKEEYHVEKSNDFKGITSYTNIITDKHTD